MSQQEGNPSVGGGVTSKISQTRKTQRRRTSWRKGDMYNQNHSHILDRNGCNGLRGAGCLLLSYVANGEVLQSPLSQGYKPAKRHGPIDLETPPGTVT
jgi:hypothetical protein